MGQTLDLRELAINREPPPSKPRRRHVLTRFVLPGAILAGFLLLVLWSLRDTLVSARPVTVLPVITTRSEVQQAGAVLFQSAGWIEPRPTPVIVPALAEGVVEKLLVVENQEVKAGDVVALLVARDATIAHHAGEADVALRKAELEIARATLASARTNFEKPLHLQAALGEVEAMLSRAELELANLPQQVRAAEARRLVAQQNYDGKKESVKSGATAEIVLQQAKSELDAAVATLEELQNRGPRLKNEVSAQTRRRDALEQRLHLKTDERKAFAEAEAGVQAATARLALSQAALEACQLRLERMVIKAPISGRVLALVARPGMRLMGIAAAALQDSSTVVTLYDPANLQVRADVRFEDLPRVQPGQPVRIHSPAAPGGHVEGEVLFSTSQADIQKNTLQVKVAIKNPPALLRPDMLVQVTFLAPTSSESAQKAEERLRLLVPRQLVETADGAAKMWVADLVDGVARRRTVKLGGTLSGELVEIVEGLSPADKLIVAGREGLREGQRIAVTGEDASLGTRN